MRAPSKKTSLNSAVPVISPIGPDLHPGLVHADQQERQATVVAGRGPVRATTKHQSHQWASDVHTFCPSITHSSPSPAAGVYSARVWTLARSDPAFGSE